MKTELKHFTALAILLMFCSNLSFAQDLYFDSGDSAVIDYTVTGSVIIEDANILMIEPAYIQGFVITGSGAMLDIYGGQIDYMLLVSTSENGMPEGQVTVYGTDFAVDGVPVEPGTTELFLQNQVLSGVYDTGTPFSFYVDCAIWGNNGGVYYQTVKLGWAQGEPDIELSHVDYDFGEVKVTYEQPGEVIIVNLGNESLTVSEIALEQDDNLQFDVEQLMVLPFTLGPDESMTLGVFFAPVVEGPSQAVLSVSSDDPDEPVVEVTFVGEGIPLPAAEQSALILDLYDLAADEGTIAGVGNKKSADNKLKTFGQMLLTADELILAGYNEYALEALMMIEAKCDGRKSPKDFIAGQDAEELNAMINKLIETLQQ